MQIFIFFNMAVIVRYLFIFHSKNPTAIQDDFWIVFLNLWASGECNLGPFVTSPQGQTLTPGMKLSLMGEFCPLNGGEVIPWG
jgi:hypothetical protein